VISRRTFIQRAGGGALVLADVRAAPRKLRLARDVRGPGRAGDHAVGSDLRVQYRAVRDARQPTSDVFAPRTFRVEPGTPQVIDESGPLPALSVR
jgi:hypothetical protein